MDQEPEVNIFVDRAHAGKPEHVDMTQPLPLPEIRGADKVEVDFSGNVIGGATFVGEQRINWGA